MNSNYSPFFVLAAISAFATFMFLYTNDAFSPAFLAIAVFAGLMSVPCGVQAALKADREEEFETIREEGG